MRILIFLTFTILQINISYAEEHNFRGKTLHDYEERCKQVLSSKGYGSEAVSNECACERNVIDKEFKTFELMITAGKGIVGKEVIDKKRVVEIKRKIKGCKNEYLSPKG